LLLSWSFDALGQVPAWLWEMRTLEDGESRSEADGGRSFRVIEQAAESFDGAGGEVAHAVLESGDVFALGFFESGLEYGLVSKPGMDCGAVETGVAGCAGNGAPLSKGGYDLGLSRRQGIIGISVEIR